MTAEEPRPGSSPEHPLPVRTASRQVRQWIDRLGQIWVEGQIAELSQRQATVWITLRDPHADLSIRVMATAGAAKAAGLAEGHRVVAQLKVNYYDRNGSLSWRAAQFRAVGVGALMQQLEQLRRTLAQEGLFQDRHKQALPVLPRRVGLICGTNSAAQRDVEVNARLQWPTVDFLVREVTVQGPKAVADVMAALVDLDGRPEVDVIVITRGGGSFEDLLAFSNEALIRAVFAARTPVVSAIGHEEDAPLLDLVADVRASTPTDAGKIIVPDMRVEAATITNALSRIRTLTGDRVHRERLAIRNLTQRPVMAGPGQIFAEQRRLVADRQHRVTRVVAGELSRQRSRLQDLQNRPVLLRPRSWLLPRATEVGALRERLRRAQAAELRSARQEVRGEAARLTALSPQGTLDRGYAVVRDGSGRVITQPTEVSDGIPLDVRVSGGRFLVSVTDVPKEDQ